MDVSINWLCPVQKFWYSVNSECCSKEKVLKAQPLALLGGGGTFRRCAWWKEVCSLGAWPLKRILWPPILLSLSVPLSLSASWLLCEVTGFLCHVLLPWCTALHTPNSNETSKTMGQNKYFTFISWFILGICYSNRNPVSKRPKVNSYLCDRYVSAHNKWVGIGRQG
jgi:hypothetical protein